MYEYEVIVRGPNSYSERGRVQSAYITDTFEAANCIAARLKEDGYIQLQNSNDGCLVILKESIMGFTVNPVEEGTE